MQAVQLVLLAAVVALVIPNVTPKADVKMQLKQYYFNTSVVYYSGKYITTARTAFMRGVSGRWWWFNDGYLCAASEPMFVKHKCTRMDPWGGGGCSRSASGVAWWILWALRWDVPWLTQYLFPVMLESGAGERALRQPVQLQVAIPGFYQQQQERKQIVKEKNWMPFLWHDQLFMVHSTFPQHRVMKIPPDGVVTQQYVTDSSTVLHTLIDKHVHGSSPIVHIPSTVAAEASSYRADGSSFSHRNNSRQGYYLGVLHYFTHEKTKKTDIKQYYHYFYKFKPDPPFDVCAISTEIPLVFRGQGKIDLTVSNSSTSQQQPSTKQYKQQRIWKDTTQTAFVNGLFLKQNSGAAGPDASGSRLMVSYGSSDIDARLLVLSLPEAEAMFVSPHDCSFVQSVSITD